MAVFCPYLAVTAMNDQFNPGLLADSSCSVDRFGLGAATIGDALGVWPGDVPAVFGLVGYNVNIFGHDALRGRARQTFAVAMVKRVPVSLLCMKEVFGISEYDRSVG